ncbi:unnamed protein product [Rangifer tarandus platyrhynchus]|uniref:Uncharacterized protein n=1 Tax=Rangifer tarandus platyrhynchus TaxID=3082113 RepID=A0AC59Z6J0_RANTA
MGSQELDTTEAPGMHPVERTSDGLPLPLGVLLSKLKHMQSVSADLDSGSILSPPLLPPVSERAQRRPGCLAVDAPCGSWSVSAPPRLHSCPLAAATPLISS